MQLVNGPLHIRLQEDMVTFYLQKTVSSTLLSAMHKGDVDDIQVHIHGHALDEAAVEEDGVQHGPRHLLHLVGLTLLSHSHADSLSHLYMYKLQINRLAWGRWGLHQYPIGGSIPSEIRPGLEGAPNPNSIHEGKDLSKHVAMPTGKHTQWPPPCGSRRR